MKILIAYLKKETVLCIAVLLAAFSMLLIHPDSKYSGYMDYRTLALLFSLMTIMEGFKQTGFFADVARALLGRVHTFRQLYLVLVMLCFFCSMWITNDVALLTFVPFTILVLELSGLQKEMIPVIVMQTIAANLGSMMTPVGNPQNLYLYSVSGMGIGEFFSVMGPLSALSFLLILGACIFHKNFVLDPELLKHMEPSGEVAGKAAKQRKRPPGMQFRNASGICKICFWRHCFSSAFFRYFE